MPRLIYHNDAGPRVEMLLGTLFANATTLYILLCQFYTLILGFTLEISKLTLDNGVGCLWACCL